jgi:hypothetical protein
VQRQQQNDQPESHTHQPFRMPSGPSTPAASDGSYGYGFSSPPPGTTSPWSSPPTPGGIDAASPSASYGLGGLTLGVGGASVPGSTNSTPRNGLKCLPEEYKEGPQQSHTRDEQVKEDEGGKIDSVAVNADISETNSTASKPGPEAASMDVDT